MKNNYKILKGIAVLILLLMISIPSFSQWSVYDGGVLPTAYSPAFVVGDNTPNPTGFKTEVIDDGAIAGNKLLSYFQPDKTYKTTYRMSWNIGTGTSGTIVMRAKAFDTDTLGMVMEIDLRNGNAGYGDKLQILYNNTIKLTESKVTAELDVKQWHTYRITMEAPAKFRVYVDENPIPVLEGDAVTARTDKYFKFGDGSSTFSTGGLIDWMVWDVTGAFVPGKGPALPKELTGIEHPIEIVRGNKWGEVFYLSSPTLVNAESKLHDQAMIDSLYKAGYNVTVTYPTKPDFSFDLLNTGDVVIIGRNVSSGDFQKKQDLWANVESPVIVLSAYLMRKDYLKLTNATAVVREVDIAIDNKDRVTKAKVADLTDPAFKNIPLTDGKIDYFKWFYDYLAYKADTFATTNNGKLLLEIVDAEKADANGRVVMARWEPGKETYPGSAVTPKAYRTYIQMGADDKSSPKFLNYLQYTTASYNMILNEIDYLIKGSQRVTYLTRAASVDANGVLLDQAVIDTLKQAGYNLTITYPGNADFSFANLDKTDLVIIGRNVSSGDFQNKAADWSKVKAPIMVTSAYISRKTRLNLLKADGVTREVTDGATVAADRITKAKVYDDKDSAFQNIAIADGKIEYLKWFYDYIAYNTDTFATTNNGKLLLSIVDAEKAAANGMLLMARWKPGIETYTGSGVFPAAYRTYMQFGADDGATPKNINYNQFTATAQQLFFNEMVYLIRTQPGKVVIRSNDATLSAIKLSHGTLSPDFAAGTLDYTGWVPEETPTVPTATVVTAFAKATVQVVKATAIPGSTSIKVTAEDGTTTKTYVINFKIKSSVDLTLKSLTLSAGEMKPAFDPEVTDYKAVVPAGTTSVNIEAIANSPTATVTGAGAFSTFPGTAEIVVKIGEKSMTYKVVFKAAGSRKTLVDPGMGTLEEALVEAMAGDTLVLKNGETYVPIASLTIDKKITIMAETIPTLPKLENMPIIKNEFATTPVIEINPDGDLSLIGIDVDAMAATNMINVSSSEHTDYTVNIFVNRCRLHNTTDDLMNDAKDFGVEKIKLATCVFKNTFIYDVTLGHALYVKNYYGSNADYIFENLTYWNIGQQFNWIRHYPVDATQAFIHNHITAYNLSVNTSANKELLGNSNAADESVYKIEVKNSIYHTQVSTNPGSFIFDNQTARHTININNNLMYKTQPFAHKGGTVNEANNKMDTDPNFKAPATFDFTVLNTSLYTAADDGKIIGALYWHPDFVDDMKDVGVVTSIENDVKLAGVVAYPNPFSTICNLKIFVPNQSDVMVSIFNLNGQMIKSVKAGQLLPGNHTISVEGSDMQPGIYIFRVEMNGQASFGRMIKM